MKLGVIYPQFELGGDPAAVRTFGLALEQEGFDYISAYDHVLGAEHAHRDPPLTGPYTEKDPFHDPLMMFAGAVKGTAPSSEWAGLGVRQWHAPSSKTS